MPDGVMERPVRLPPWVKAALALRIWYWFVVVRVSLKRRPLPELIRRLGRVSHVRQGSLEPVRLGRAVAGALRIGPLNPRCLFTALVLYRLLHREGEPAEIVIGMPMEPRDKDAHAWVEVNGVDVGPPPGRGRHQELARYG
jgi:hypothetical protein